MAKAFVVDTDKAQQIGGRLTSLGRAVGSLGPGPRPRGPLGSGVLERAWTEHEQTVATARQDLVKAVDESGRGFTTLAREAIGLDQQKAEEVETI